MNWSEINIGADWDRKTNFVQRGKKSSKVVDFTNKIEVDELMRFDVVKELNFELPKKNESLLLVTTKPISLLDVLNYIENIRGKIQEAIIYVFTINDKGARYVSDLSKRTKLKLIVSDIINSKREKERLISNILENENVDFIFCHNHAKLIGIKIEDDYYTLTGSMNAGTNAKIETLQIFNSKEVFNFVKKTATLLERDFKIEKRY